MSQPEGTGDYALFGNDSINNIDGAEIQIKGGMFKGRIKKLVDPVSNPYGTTIYISDDCAFSEDCSENVIFADENTMLMEDTEGLWRLVPKV